MDTNHIQVCLASLQVWLNNCFYRFDWTSIKEEGFVEVQRSNMSKLGEDGKPIYRESDGKIMKGPNYSPPDLAPILHAHQERIRLGS